MAKRALLFTETLISFNDGNYYSFINRNIRMEFYNFIIHLKIKIMKELKKIKLNQIVKSEIKNDELKHILGGACTDYSCDCSNPNLYVSTVVLDATIDGRAYAGYYP